MAHNLDVPEFWLPPLFLSDDDFKKTEFPLSESNSGFSSPVDSSMGSTETESDEDGFLTELTRRLTSSIHLSHDIWKPKPNHGLLSNEKTDTLWKMPTFPQSTLCNGKVAKITRLQQDSTSDYIHFWAPSQKPCHDYVPSTKNHAYHSNQRILYQPRQQNANSNGRALGLSPSAWPTLQQSQSHKQPLPVSWSTRAAVLSNNVTKGGCSGTGVFLPRPVATTPTQTSRRKHPVASKQRNVLTQSQQRRNVSHESLATMTNNEIRLPQEWTY